MFTPLTGRTVLVTGGSKGIGKGIAGVFAQAGCDVVLAARDPATGEAAAQELGARFVQADIARAEDCERMAAEVGDIDVLCANAGIFPDVKLVDMTAEDIDAIFATNVKGTMLSVKACLPALERSGHGRVIVTSSITGPITGFPGLVALRRDQGRAARLHPHGGDRARPEEHHHQRRPARQHGV